MIPKILRILFAIFAVSASLAADDQSSIHVDETKIHAFLRNESTVIAIPVSNVAERTVKAELSLAWLNVNEKESAPVRQEIAIKPGQTEFETPLRLVEPSIWTRLRYSLVPDRADARSFAPISGIVSLTHIADHVFELGVGYADEPISGNPLTIVAEAVHPITRTPFPDLQWSAELSIDKKRILPSASSQAPITTSLS